MIRREHRGVVQEHRDIVQVFEMQLSELQRERERDDRLKARSERDAKTWRKQATAHSIRADAAWERERDALKVARAAEGETRRVSLQNLGLQRKLALLSDAIPRSEHSSVCEELGRKVAEQAEQIAALEEQLVERNGESEGEESVGEETKFMWN